MIFIIGVYSAREYIS